MAQARGDKDGSIIFRKKSRHSMLEKLSIIQEKALKQFKMKTMLYRKYNQGWNIKP